MWAGPVLVQRAKIEQRMVCVQEAAQVQKEGCLLADKATKGAVMTCYANRSPIYKELPAHNMIRITDCLLSSVLHAQATAVATAALHYMACRFVGQSMPDLTAVLFPET